MSTVIDDLNGLPERIRTSSERLADLRQQLAAELETRDSLVVAAVDHAGMARREVAAAAGVSYSYLIRILSGSSDD